MRMRPAMGRGVLVSAGAVFALGAILSVTERRLAVAVPEASEFAFAIDPMQSKVHWTLGTTLHAVHRTFAMKRGAVRVDATSGKASGEIVADATSGQSGNDSRDKKLHKEILESARFTEVIFRPDRVEGKLPEAGAAEVQIHGMIGLHGAQHELTVPASLERDSEVSRALCGMGIEERE